MPETNLSPSEMATLLDDVKTIKAILQNNDAPLPRLWRPLFTAAGLMALVGLLQYALPFFRQLSFDHQVLFLWLPAACLAFPLLIWLLYRELAQTGRQFLVRGPIRHVLFARFVIPPSAAVLVWVLAHSSPFSVEGAVLLVIAMWQTALEGVFPSSFRLIPLVFMCLGMTELLLGLSSPEVTLFNVLLTAAAIAYGAQLFRRGRQDV